MTRRLIKALVAFALAFAASLSCGVAAFAEAAANAPDLSKSCSVTVSVANGGGCSLALYRVADVSWSDSGLSYVLTGEFAASGADLSNLESSTLASMLAEYATTAGASPAATATTAKDGTSHFSSLSAGLYLVAQSASDASGVTVSPFLVQLPAFEDGAWVYNATAKPKFESTKYVEITVRKVWNDGGDEASRPSSVKVTLYRGGTAVATVELNDGNSWTYTWTGLQKSDSYSIVEDAVAGYTAEYTSAGDTFTVTNTPTSDTPDSPSDATTPKKKSRLAYTGLLEWPVPVLAGLGVVVFALGWRLAGNRGGDDER